MRYKYKLIFEVTDHFNKYQVTETVSWECNVADALKRGEEMAEKRSDSKKKWVLKKVIG